MKGTDGIFIVVLLIVCGLTAFVGLAVPQYNFQHDVFFFLDNAYRVTQGQIPHRDFSSAWGPLMYLIDAAGLLLSGMQPAGIGYANALFGALIAAWVFLLTRTRWPPLIACAAGIYTVLLITAPFPLGTPALAFSLAMTYNRYGYALFGIIVIECAASAFKAQTTTKQKVRGSLSTGAALGLLAFLKISYALVAVPFVAVLMMAVSASKIRRLLGLGGGFAIVTICILCYLGFDVADMLQDLAMAASARRLSLDISKLWHIQVLVENIPLLLLAGYLLKNKPGIFCAAGARISAILITLLAMAADIALFLSNQQEDTLPLQAYAMLALAAGAYKYTTGVKSSQPSRIAALLLGFYFLLLCMPSAISLTGAAVEREWPTRPRVMALKAPGRGEALSFAPVVSKFKTQVDGAEYVEAVNDGLRLLRQNTQNTDGVLVFDMFNPFNYLLNRPSPTGGFAAAPYNYVFSDAVHPTPERFFGNTRYVVVHKYKPAAPDRLEEDSHVNGLMRLYGDSLRANFTAVQETQYWTLWHHK